VHALEQALGLAEGVRPFLGEPPEERTRDTVVEGFYGSGGTALQGAGASPGVAEGVARVVADTGDLARVQSGTGFYELGAALWNHLPRMGERMREQRIERPALTAAVAGNLLVNWYFVPPLYTFTIADTKNWFALLVFLVTAVVVSELATRSRRRAEEAEEALAALRKLRYVVRSGVARSVEDLHALAQK